MERTNRAKTQALEYPKAYVVKAKSTLFHFTSSEKYPLGSLLFLFPKKSGWTFRGPRKSQDFKGKRSNRATTTCLRQQNVISDHCDVVRFVAKRHKNQEKSNEMKFLTTISDFKTESSLSTSSLVYTLFFLCLLRSGLFLHPQCEKLVFGVIGCKYG